jgi:putative acetyltransferase
VADFARLNIEWLERGFTVEPHDREVLGDPEAHILAPGGRILFAVDQADKALGTGLSRSCATTTTKSS